MGRPALVLVDGDRKRIGADTYRIYIDGYGRSGIYDGVTPPWAEHYWAAAEHRDETLDLDDSRITVMTRRYYSDPPNGGWCVAASLKNSVAYPSVGNTILGSCYPQFFTGQSFSDITNKSLLRLNHWNAQNPEHAYPNEWCVGLAYGLSYDDEPNTPCTTEALAYVAGIEALIGSTTPSVLVVDASGFSVNNRYNRGGMRAFRSGDVVAEFDGSSDLEGALEDGIAYIAANFDPAPA